MPPKKGSKKPAKKRDREIDGNETDSSSQRGSTKNTPSIAADSSSPVLGAAASDPMSPHELPPAVLRKSSSSKRKASPSSPRANSSPLASPVQNSKKRATPKKKRTPNSGPSEEDTVRQGENDNEKMNSSEGENLQQHEFGTRNTGRLSGRRSQQDAAVRNSSGGGGGAPRQRNSVVVLDDDEGELKALPATIYADGDDHRVALSLTPFQETMTNQGGSGHNQGNPSGPLEGWHGTYCDVPVRLPTGEDSEGNVEWAVQDAFLTIAVFVQA